MVVIGNNLLGLIKQHEICEERLFDHFSINLELDNLVYRPKKDVQNIIKYDIQDAAKHYEKSALEDGELILNAGDAVLGCSFNEIKMPPGYLGFIQTKGTLARLFVSVHCSDSQIEPGFVGKITFEIVNHSPFTISLNFKAKVAQLFIFQCSTNNSEEVYNGRYQNAKAPTLPSLSRYN